MAAYKSAVRDFLESKFVKTEPDPISTGPARNPNPQDGTESYCLKLIGLYTLSHCISNLGVKVTVLITLLTGISPSLLNAIPAWALR